MKLQDEHPYNSAILGLNDQYIPIGKDSFYINDEIIIAKDKTITTGRTYVLMTNSPEAGFNVRNVRLFDVYYDNINLNIIVEDLNTNNILTIVHSFYDNNNCFLRLIDWKYMKSLFERKVGQDYCGCSV